MSGYPRIFGWIGLFVMGFAYQAFPRLADGTRVTAHRAPDAWTHFCQALLNLNEFVYLE